MSTTPHDPAPRDDRDRDRYRGRDEDIVEPRARRRLVDREAEAFGGIKWGSAFFGWLTATGMALLLTALASAAGAAVGANTSEAVVEENAQTISIVGAVILLVILFLAYYCGGYVAGRMARFDGVKQGLAVWLWALIIAVLVALLGLVLGDQFNVFAQLNAFPRIPVSEGDLTTMGIIAAVAVALVSLLGAIVGGKAGMRFHRRVDDVDLV